MNGGLIGSFALDLCCAYNETQDVFEGILKLESFVFPLLKAKSKGADNG